MNKINLNKYKYYFISKTLLNSSSLASFTSSSSSSSFIKSNYFNSIGKLTIPSISSSFSSFCISPIVIKKQWFTSTTINKNANNNNNNITTQNKERIITPELKPMNSNNSTSLFNEKKATAIQFNWFESETDYNIEARLLIGVSPENLHIFIQNHQIIFETKSDSTDDKAFKSDLDTTINVIQRSSLYLRRTIDIPKNVNEDSITAKIAGDIVTIKMPKQDINVESSRKDIKFQE